MIVPNAFEISTLPGPFGKDGVGGIDQGKKNKKHFHFKESHEVWCSIVSEMKPVFEGVNKDKLRKMWKELKPAQRRNLLKQLKLDPKIADLDFKDLTDKDIKSLSSLDKTTLSTALTVALSVAISGLALNILDAPIDKPVSDIKDEPLPDPINIKTDDRQPSFDQASSFVGNVDYFPEDLSMEIHLNNKLYAFCNVPERVFDAFEGASSKGAYFNRNIKTQFDC